MPRIHVLIQANNGNPSAIHNGTAYSNINTKRKGKQQLGNKHSFGCEAKLIWNMVHVTAFATHNTLTDSSVQKLKYAKRLGCVNALNCTAPSLHIHQLNF